MSMSKSMNNLFLLSTHGTWGTTDCDKLDEIIALFRKNAELAFYRCDHTDKKVYLGYDGDAIQRYCNSKLGKNIRAENGISQDELSSYNSDIILLEDLVPPTLYLLVMIDKFQKGGYKVTLVQCQNLYISCFSKIADYLDSPAGEIWVKRLG